VRIDVDFMVVDGSAAGFLGASRLTKDGTTGGLGVRSACPSLDIPQSPKRFSCLLLDYRARFALEGILRSPKIPLRRL
jgi:hypothetical protein